MNPFKFIDLFAGIGGMRIPFERLGGTCVFSSEWDVHAQQTYHHNFGEIPAGDITKIDETEIPDHDILWQDFHANRSVLSAISKDLRTHGELCFSTSLGF